jgi:hypothetical protein
MSQLASYSCVDLAFAYKTSKQNKLPTGIDNFLHECVRENKEEIVKSISRLHQYQPMFIIETFTYEIISGIFAAKSQKELLTIIKSGSVFGIKEKLISAFLNDVDIKQVIEGGNVNDQIR